MTARDQPTARLTSPIWFYGAAGLVAAATVLWLVSDLPGHLLNATRFILYDQGSYLYAIGCWQGGERLYRDFAWQYGPLALGWYRAFAAVGGNTPLTLVVASSVAFVAGWSLIARLVQRVAGWAWGAAFALLVLLPVMVPAGPLAFNGPHGAVEMLLLAACGWLLARPDSSRGNAAQLGAVAGLLQWVRFGPHVVALAAILLVTAWRRWPGAASRSYFVALAGFTLRLLAGYALVFVPLAAWYFAALPAAGAGEQLWPRYMVAHYAGTYRDRWPEISSLGDFATTWLPAVISLVLALVILLRGFARRVAAVPSTSKSAAVAGLLFFPLYYLVGAGVLFHNGYALSGHLWLVWPGLAALAVAVHSRWWRLGVALALAPGIYSVWSGVRLTVASEQAWQSHPVQLPNGQTLWFHGEEERRFAILSAALEGPAGPRRVAVFLAGGGVHHFFGNPRVGRHWWFLPEFVRPWEEAEATRALLQHELFFVADLGQATAPTNGVVTLWLPLPPAASAAVLPHLGKARPVAGLGTLLDVTP